MFAKLSYGNMDSDPSLHRISTSNSDLLKCYVLEKEAISYWEMRLLFNPEFVLSSWHMRTAC